MALGLARAAAGGGVNATARRGGAAAAAATRGAGVPLRLPPRRVGAPRAPGAAPLERRAPRTCPPPAASAADGLPGDPAAALHLACGPHASPEPRAPRLAGLRAKARAQLTSEYDAELFTLALPALASMLLEPIMNVISASMIGHLGTQQMAAVSLGSLAVSFATFTFAFLIFLTTPKIAAAHVNGDAARVSRHAAVGLWLAFGCGLVVTAGLITFSDAIIAALRPPEPAVAAYASEFIRIRAWGILSALVGYVAAGTFRGIKDTVTPLQAAAIATTCNLALSVVFIYGLDMGVAGAALGATLASWVSAAMLISLLFRKRLLRAADAARRPAWREVQPYVSQGLVLAFRMVVTFGIVMYASAMCVRVGAASQAAFEIIRQVWILSIQVFECLNVATQSMAASLLGSGDRAGALALLGRATLLSVGVGAAVGVGLLLLQGPLISVFTSDAAVTGMVLGIMPMIAALMPLDAGASIADGGFIAAGQTNMLSAIQVFGSLAQFAVLSWAAANGAASAFTVWAVLKLMSVFRFAGGAYVHFLSPISAYLPAAGEEQQQQEQEQQEQQEQEQQQQQQQRRQREEEEHEGKQRRHQQPQLELGPEALAGVFALDSGLPAREPVHAPRAPSPEAPSLEQLTGLAPPLPVSVPLASRDGEADGELRRRQAAAPRPADAGV